MSYEQGIESLDPEKKWTREGLKSGCAQFGRDADREITELKTQLAHSGDSIGKYIHSTSELLEQLANSIPKELLKDLLYACDGLHCAYSDSNYGDAKEWLRHIDKAYSEYQDLLSNQSINQGEE